MGSKAPARELTGRIVKVNDEHTALQIDPPGEWFRISRFAEANVSRLMAGQFVTLGLDREDWVRTATLNAPQERENGPSNANLTAPAAGRPFVSTERREGHILRQTALKCAVDWCTQQIEDYGPEDVCGIAETFLSWLADGEPGGPTGRGEDG